MKCIKCSETRETEFYPSSLKRSDYRCKTCVNKSHREWRLSNLEHHRKYQREWMANHPKENTRNYRRWRKNHLGEANAKRLDYYYKHEKGTDRHYAHCQAFYRFPEARLCEIDECSSLGERHHDDYSKPLEIKWLCKKHHKKLHRVY